jgi:O-antigen ligase
MTTADPQDRPAPAGVEPLFGAGASAGRETGGPGTPRLSGLMLAVIVATPVVAYVGNLAFAPLVALAGAACLPVVVRGRRPAPILWVFLIGLAWALISLAWSPVHPPQVMSYKGLESFTALKLVLQLPLYAAFVIAAGHVSQAGARRALTVLAVGLLVLGAVVVVEGLRGQALYLTIRQAAHQATRPDLARRDVARAVYPMTLFLWPCLAAFPRRLWVGALLALTTLAAAGLLHVDAPVVALVAGAAAYVAARFGRRAGVLGLSIAAAVYFGLAPVLVRLGTLAGASHAADVGKLSWGERTRIWSFVTDRIFEKPLWGWGLDASRVFPDDVPLHPHDAALQLWLELGAPGAALAAVLAVIVFGATEEVRRTDPFAGASAAAVTAAYLAIGALSFGVWQEWWLALGALAAAVVRLSIQARASTAEPRLASA